MKVSLIYMFDDFVTVEEEVCNEYEFEKFSLIHNLTKQKWELHFYDEDQGELFIYLENTSFEDEQELFSEIEFTEELFKNIIEFEENNHGK